MILVIRVTSERCRAWPWSCMVLHVHTVYISLQHQHGPGADINASARLAAEISLGLDMVFCIVNTPMFRPRSQPNAVAGPSQPPVDHSAAPQDVIEPPIPITEPLNHASGSGESFYSKIMTDK